LSCYQRIGFPDHYRRDYEPVIFDDIRGKLTNLDLENKTVLDIGPGCSDLPKMLMDLCQRQGHHLLLCDSQEMLDHLPDASFVKKVSGCFPKEVGDFVAENAGRVDVILTYSVLHYVFVDLPLFEFLDRSLQMLAEGGQMLIGDIPNVSKRKRFFRSAAGIRYHQEFTRTAEIPTVEFNQLEPGKIEDAALMAIVGRCRSAGFDAYIVPQGRGLPMANRREDILIHRP
jgi:hypothetical protein